MTNPDLRSLLNSEWARIDQEAEARRDSPSALLELAQLYRGLSVQERLSAGEVLIEWALSANERKQFDGLALIDEFDVVSAVPALYRLADRFRHAEGPSAVYDLAKVNRILTRLTTIGGPNISVTPQPEQDNPG